MQLLRPKYRTLVGSRVSLNYHESDTHKDRTEYSIIPLGNFSL